MDIGVPVKEIGEIEVATLIAAIMNIDTEAWFANNHRQNAYEVHAQTHMQTNSQPVAPQFRH